MKVFEISSRKTKNGRRKFKMILHKIFPDSCVDEVNEVGTKFNLNGITWIEKYCRKALPSIKGMSLRCEFIDEDRTEIHGHGHTNYADGDPVFENAVQIGTFTKGYIDQIEDEDGETITACIGEGEIDALCYHNFVEKLDENIKLGIYPHGSVEILHTDDNENIIYKYGYKDEGRIPSEFIYSGYALLGIQPADESAKLIELNEKHKEDLVEMNEEQVKAVIEQTVNKMNELNSEMAKCQEECEAKIAKANEEKETAVSEKNEIEGNVAELQTALDQCKAELQAKCDEMDALWAERNELEKALNEARAKERIAALNNALSEFNETEKEYATDEINAFNENPIEGDIDSIVMKINAGIGAATKAEAKAKAAEQNSADNGDIFEEMHVSTNDVDDDVNIF